MSPKPATTLSADEAIDYPKSWIWDEDGDLVEGTFVKFDQGQTKQYGAKVIMVTSVAGVERSVWLTQTVLFNQVRDELGKRPSKTLEPGERVVIRRLGKKESEAGTSYWNFRTLFPDRPELDAADLFGLEPEEGLVRYGEGNVDPDGDVKRDDGDIPF
jgi:hypothetical protein